MVKKVVSFSLYGNLPKYCLGLIENIENINELMPDWYIYVYYDDVPEKFIDFIKTFGNNVVLKKCQLSEYKWEGMFWRFFQFDDEETDIWINRDLDSRITKRDVRLVNLWINSNYPFHIMREDPTQNVQIMGNMFGVKNKPFKKYKRNTIARYIELYHDRYPKERGKGPDQKFLRREIWPSIIKNHLAHLGCEDVRFLPQDVLIPLENDEVYSGQVDKIKDETYKKYLDLLE